MRGAISLLAAGSCLAAPITAEARMAQQAAATPAVATAPAAQTSTPPPAPLAPPAVAATPAMLSSGTIVMVVLDEELSSKGSKLGDEFRVVVDQDVVANGAVVIPKGTLGYGEVSYVTDRGGFGKGGILGIQLKSLDLDGRTVALDGRYREEGKQNEGGAVATMFVAGIFAALVKGKGSIIPRGRILKARTGEDIAYPAAATMMAATAPGAPAPVVAPAVATVQPAVATAQPAVAAPHSAPAMPQPAIASSPTGHPMTGAVPATASQPPAAAASPTGAKTTPASATTGNH